MKSLFLGVSASLVCLLIFSTELSAQTVLQKKPTRSGATIRTGSNIQTYTLRCHGGNPDSFPITASYPLPESRDQSSAEIFLRFRKGAETNRLAPGECSWLDRPVNSEEPTEVRLTGTPDVIKNLVEKMSSSKYMADFSSYNTNQGYFRAVSHSIWKLPSAESNVIRIIRNSNNPPRVEPQSITNVSTAPDLYSAKISFQAKNSARLLVEVSTRAPNGLNFDRRFVTSSVYVDSNGGNNRSAVTINGLRSGQRYYFIISVVSGSGANDPLVKYLGDFSTQVRIDP